MFGIFKTARRMREKGILGMNRRNADLILGQNPRRHFPLVDDKVRMRDLCLKIGVPTPRIYLVLAQVGSLRRLDSLLSPYSEFVIKPAKGAAGRGILVITGKSGQNFLKHDGQPLSADQVRHHLTDILSGMYSLGGQPDLALIQERVRLHPAFGPLAFQGIPDVRVIVYRGRPAMAMLRLPTRSSGGRANLHQGGIGTGIHLQTGLTHHAVQFNRAVRSHPDTGVALMGFRVPVWSRVLDMSCRVARATGLGYLGVDIVHDAEQGPLLLEANARPGLAIQIANGQGLLPALRSIEEGNGEMLPPWEEEGPDLLAGKIILPLPQKMSASKVGY